MDEKRKKQFKKLYKGLVNVDLNEIPEIDYINQSHLKGMKYTSYHEERWYEYRYL